MDFFFKPRGIAVIGATPNPKGGLAILINLSKGFSGGIYPVNPRYAEIAGFACYPSILEVPDPVDLAIVFVPAPRVPEILAQCGQKGVKGVMLECAGFAETGPAGKSLQETVRSIGQKTGMRLWGPNCMGLFDAVNGHIFSFVSPAIWEEGLVPGGVSLIVQSGMLSGGFLVDTMSHGIMGVSKVCSIGNKVDVNECDLLEYLLADAQTSAIGLYLESFADGRRFFSLCRQAAKPIVLLKGGKSPRGAEAAMSHTASLAGNAGVMRGALSQAGVTEAHDFKQMMDLARALAMVPETLPGARGRIAILTYSGGAGILSSDFMHELGLEVSRLSPGTVEVLERLFPDWMPVKNPVDLWPAVEKHGGDAVYPRAVEAVLADPEVDAVLLHAFVGGFASNLDLERIAATAKSARKPVFIWLLGSRQAARDFHQQAQRLGFPVYRELYRAVECLAAVFAGGRRSAPAEASAA